MRPPLATVAHEEEIKVGSASRIDYYSLSVDYYFFGRRVVFLKNKHLFCIVLHMFYYDRYYHFLLIQ